MKRHIALTRLTPGNVTVASAVMLPANTALMFAYGWVFLVDPYDNLETAASLTYARGIFGTMEPWGWLFVILGTALTFALVVHLRVVFIVTLSLCSSTWLLWAFMALHSAHLDMNASPNAPLLPLYAAISCFATIVSLLKDEV